VHSLFFPHVSRADAEQDETDARRSTRQAPESSPKADQAARARCVVFFS